jgi:3-vinyl bacteriochlorophyllide hydratase
MHKHNSALDPRPDPNRPGGDRLAGVAAAELAGVGAPSATARRNLSHKAWAMPSFANDWIDAIAPSPWPASAGSSSLHAMSASAAGQRFSTTMPSASAGTSVSSARVREPLYTPEERARRDASVWTLVQGVLAPLQFVVFLVSLGLILNTLATGAGYEIATASVVVKTLVLYTIMITGSIWEKVVFGRWLFARSFFWEDVFSMLVLALHTAYLIAIGLKIGDANAQLMLALAAYAAYVINAGQFLWKLRMARLETPTSSRTGGARGSPAGSNTNGGGFSHAEAA